MGKWQQSLEKAIKYSQNVMKKQKSDAEFYDKKATAAAEIVATHKLMKPRLKSYGSDIQTVLEALGRAAAELSVYEDDLGTAKKEKGSDAKTKVKDLEKKMKPLAKQFNDTKKELGELINNYNEDKNALNEKIQAL